MRYPKSELIAGVIMGGFVSVLMEVVIFGVFLNGIRQVVLTGEFLPWVDKVFVAAFGMIFCMGLALYAFSLHHLREGDNTK